MSYQGLVETCKAPGRCFSPISAKACKSDKPAKETSEREGARRFEGRRPPGSKQEMLQIASSKHQAKHPSVCQPPLTSNLKRTKAQVTRLT